MATGCYPIQTNTSCANEWISQISGSIVSASSAEEISLEIIDALQSDTKVNQSAITNSATISQRVERAQIKVIAEHFYDMKAT
jgi:hypothetical protein